MEDIYADPNNFELGWVSISRPIMEKLLASYDNEGRGQFRIYIHPVNPMTGHRIAQFTTYDGNYSPIEEATKNGTLNLEAPINPNS